MLGLPSLSLLVAVLGAAAAARSAPAVKTRGTGPTVDKTLAAPTQPTEPAATPMDPAREHFAGGRELFAAGDAAGALVEFRLSFDLSGNIEALFGMAQCEYHLGKLKDARAHYEQYRKSPGRADERAELARLRVEAIDQRPSTLVLETEPDGVEVSLVPLDGDGAPVTGQGPNRFEIRRGRWRVSVARRNYVTYTNEHTLDLAETKTLFVRLEPTPARLEIRTHPPHATLYVRGVRARNPFNQNVTAGSYELYGEATDYEARTDVVTVAPGEHKVVEFRLPYLQRSGRPDLIGFSAVVGAVAGGSAVVARLNTDPDAASVTASAAVVAAGAALGGIGGGFLATSLAPAYIPDNVALFRIGAMWTGALEGGALGLALNRSLSAGWIGGAVGLAAGAVAAPWLDGSAPNYGRAVLIQSATGSGALAGALTVAAFANELGLEARQHTAAGVLVGLNLGLGAGLAMAYLPDQRLYGPSWQRVVLVDLAIATGALAGALFETVGECLRTTSPDCRFEESRRMPKLALLGGALGLGAGWFLTRKLDLGNDRPHAGARLLPVPTALVTPGVSGTRVVPGLAAQGRF